jgi:hypothetical protein
MKPVYTNGNVKANCPDCQGALTTFESMKGNKGYGEFNIPYKHSYNDKNYQYVSYVLLKCAGCSRGGFAKIHRRNIGRFLGEMEEFYPYSMECLKIPDNVPEDIKKEFREAENCLGFKLYRASSVLFRSSLEKILKANGYKDGVLINKIDEATKDGVITESRKKLANENIRVLGNDVLHDEWREINLDEVEQSHKYIQRILEDFYDERTTVENILKEKGRIIEEK